MFAKLKAFSERDGRAAERQTNDKRTKNARKTLDCLARLHMPSLLTSYCFFLWEYKGCEIVDQAAKVAGIPAPSLADGALPYRDLHGNRHLFKGRHDESIIDYDTRFGMRGSECAISGNGSARSSF